MPDSHWPEFEAVNRVRATRIVDAQSLPKGPYRLLQVDPHGNGQLEPFLPIRVTDADHAEIGDYAVILGHDLRTVIPAAEFERDYKPVAPAPANPEAVSA